jgi:hypothetical protein
MSRLFGDIIQNGYVVRDIAAAMRHWIEVLGVLSTAISSTPGTKAYSTSATAAGISTPI